MVSAGKRTLAHQRQRRSPNLAHHITLLRRRLEASPAKGPTTTEAESELRAFRAFADAFEQRMMGDLLADPLEALDNRSEFTGLKHAWSLYEEQSTARQQTEYASGIVTIDGKGRIVDINEPALLLLGFDNAGELVGASFNNLLRPSDARTQLEDELARTNVKGASIQYMSTRDGSERVIDLSVSPRAQAYRCTILITDITARIQLEHELRRARDLALMHEHQTSEFLANMSHELRTPMNGVIGMTDLLSDTPLDVQQKEIVHLLKHSGEHLLCIINDILDLSKLEAGHVVLESIPVDLEKTLQQDLHALEVSAFSKGLDFVLSASPDVPATCDLDPLRVRQILTNLVGNAIKFTESGHILVRCSVTQANGASPRLLLEVEDSGVGIQQDMIPKLFAPFTQADARTARKYGGTGLGLTICKKLTTYMGGDIGARSVPGYGSTFWFSLPLVNPSAPLRNRYTQLAPRKLGVLLCTELLESALALRAQSINVEVVDLSTLPPDATPPELIAVLLEAEADPSNARQLAARFALPISQVGVVASRPDRLLRELVVSQGATPICRTLPLAELVALTTPGHIPTAAERDTPAESRPFAHVKLMVAEDNPVNQKLVVRLLQMLGAQVLLANDGLQAVAIAKQNPDLMLVFMDCQMPNMDGFDAAREIRKLYPSLPICALTANAMSSDRDKCFSAGMNDYLTKPIRRADLAATLQQWTLANR
jgi:two-component system, sensor histidine kinase and response regulator